ncbi:ribonuclease toxin immunity protein CdiI [Cytobacillus horneckiae]|uniref:CDI immunity protein domain-containing protein n=1 Tax=Cytobacillus horneckiae TaxID=549687 RepID=A0A2N0ZJ03_9BACI|nr:ribonuclease toxin immunity protein CdiI [Cytobacillus horneckiae]MCM3179367.1 ribonuclease toxin immunity protein CdiI [Cytobacillus horneckiae]MEC1158969.1 ribonuclease toxin immunity protein CdiI [Cytobacillus horneckiae]MED2937923.1 ribonuclease toxin immunity protein CdiI [Cytobacillus horneckiae]PKG29510.1 hypothetical protein CWS20_08295 [Cytobacillus horneckiae]
MENHEKELITTFYRHMGDGKFLKILNCYAEGKGYGTEYARFVFANYYEKWEEDYFGDSGIAYYIDAPLVAEDEEVILNDETFFQYLKEDCEKYLMKHPNDEHEVRILQEKIRTRIQIEES